ncbi:hypothetical protein [Yoonia sp. 72]|nr:hypothetical protein [Yoonia sp. 72]
MLWTRLAADLMGPTVLIDVFARGADLPLQTALHVPELAAFAAVLWHAVSVVLIVLTYGLWVLAQRRGLAFKFVLSGVQVGCPAMFLLYGLRRLGTVIDMPQWMIFLIIPALTRFDESRERVL